MRIFFTVLLLAGCSALALGNEPTPALPPAPRSVVVVEPISETKTPAELTVEKVPAPTPEQAQEYKAATGAMLGKRPCKCVERTERVCVKTCERDCYPVASFLKRELVEKPAYGVKSALVKAEERRLEKAECRLSKKACACGNSNLCLGTLACEASKLECRKAKVAADRAALDAKHCELFGNR
jgi:hypothetical protein